MMMSSTVLSMMMMAMMMASLLILEVNGFQPRSSTFLVKRGVFSDSAGWRQQFEKRGSSLKLLQQKHAGSGGGQQHESGKKNPLQQQQYQLHHQDNHNNSGVDTSSHQGLGGFSSSTSSKTKAAVAATSTIPSIQVDEQEHRPQQQQHQQKKPGSAKLDTPWEKLGFEFRATNSHIRMTYRDGAWGAPEVQTDPYVNLHIAATALHYGQSCFEGLKAFCHADGSVHMFRPEENALRMQRSCRRVLMPDVPTDLFVKACEMAVLDNLEYVPPYGSNGALYVRPVLFGSGPRIGVQPADEYHFIVMVIPVGDYYKGQLARPVDGVIIRDYDRAAPRGVGHVKVAGNYAADMLPVTEIKNAGFCIGLYLDAATQTKIEEFNTSNFVGIDRKNKKYITPLTNSVLPSITNKSLMQIAQDHGMTVEQRSVNLEELHTLDEVMAVGTAVVVTPIGSLTMFSNNGQDQEVVDTKFVFGNEDEIGPVSKELYQYVRQIQTGDAPDIYGWNHQIR